MTTIRANDRSTQLAMHTLGAAMAMAVTRSPVVLDLEGLPSGSRDRAAVVEGRIREVMADLEGVIRGQRMGLTDVPPAVLGRRMVSNDDHNDPTNRTYTAGKAFDVFVKALCVEADARPYR